MRALFTSPPGLGHIYPMVPLARAMVARGHDVLWATPADGVAHVERAGIAAVATGPAGLPGPAEVRRLYPDLEALPLIEMPDAMFAKIFGAVAAPQILSDLVAVALRQDVHRVAYGDGAERKEPSPDFHAQIGGISRELMHQQQPARLARFGR